MKKLEESKTLRVRCMQFVQEESSKVSFPTALSHSFPPRSEASLYTLLDYEDLVHKRVSGLSCRACHTEDSWDRCQLFFRVYVQTYLFIETLFLLLDRRHTHTHTDIRKKSPDFRLLSWWWKEANSFISIHRWEVCLKKRKTWEETRIHTTTSTVVHACMHA